MGLRGSDFRRRLGGQLELEPFQPQLQLILGNALSPCLATFTGEMLLPIHAGELQSSVGDNTVEAQALGGDERTE